MLHQVIWIQGLPSDIVSDHNWTTICFWILEELNTYIHCLSNISEPDLLEWPFDLVGVCLQHDPHHSQFLSYQMPQFQANDGGEGVPLILFRGEVLPPDLGQALEGLPPGPGTDEGGSWLASTQLDALHS